MPRNANLPGSGARAPKSLRWAAPRESMVPKRNSALHGEEGEKNERQHVPMHTLSRGSLTQNEQGNFHPSILKAAPIVTSQLTERKENLE